MDMTKAETLRFLEGKLSFSTVLPSVVFSVGEWRKTPSKILSQIKEAFSGRHIIVRSSAIGEDSEKESQAGKFTSVLDIPSLEEERVKEAIEEVIGSYDGGDAHQILVQEFLTELEISGVVFTTVSKTKAPYYVINYDAEGKSDTVTSGSKGALRTYYYFKDSPYPPDNPVLERIIESVKEIEGIFPGKYLDIEFGVKKKGEIVIFQVRPAVVEEETSVPSRISLKNALDLLSRRITVSLDKHPGLCGSTGILSVMTDWNPAEMIGRKPRALALSLYKELITDSVWAYQRHNYGYRNLRSFPLIISLIGQPYIDVRLSFNSFIPSRLNGDLANRLVDYYVSELRKSPEKHDKVEFDIVFSCYDLDINDRLKVLLEHGFTELDLDRIKFSLLNLTNDVVSPNGLFWKDLAKLDILERKHKEILSSSLPVLDKIYWLIENCKRYGTLPFAGLARAGFIAVQMLRSMVASGVITDEESAAFLNSLNTVSKQLAHDFKMYRRGKISKEKLMAKYGHLRPGTYDIRSKRYDMAFDSYFPPPSSENEGDDCNDGEEEFSFSSEVYAQLDKALNDNGFLITGSDLVHL
ncbi:MAG: hypothetical protein D6808_05455 [Candidatus Dadabacteria bacterium]|nr:MAG: hypothetical protein D6808_05455 [Candidatus Dadabacteria bacterium]